MEKEAVIRISSIHGNEGEEPDVIEFSSDCMYSYDEATETAIAVYYESEVTGMTGTRTRMTVKPDRVIVAREGLVSSEMLFRVGERVSFLYDTPYGSATVGLDTHSIVQSFDEHGGDVVIKYALNLEHTMAIMNRFCLHVEELK